MTITDANPAATTTITINSFTLSKEFSAEPYKGKAGDGTVGGARPGWNGDRGQQRV